MERVKVAKTGRYFERGGKPFFLLSDTNWMAFQKLSLKEWEEIVRTRREQGFTALQISVFPILHDNCESPRDIDPFMKKDGKYDYDSINEAYFDHAEKMLELMCNYGLIPFLHLFWVDYVDSRAASWTQNTIIPFERLEPLTAYIVKRFKKYAPIYSVSGDTKLDLKELETSYMHILDNLLKFDPEGLTTLHLYPGADPSDELCAHPQYHFYAYQSGHNVSEKLGEGQLSMLTYSRQFLDKKYKKPIVNTEPCYEGHGFGGAYGRFNARDVRFAVWRSVLSGANAGVSYGAHGLWQTYESGEPFNNANFSSMPYAWRTALQFDGAWDVGYLKWLFEQYGMERLTPSSDYEARSDCLCMGASDTLIVIYLPYNDDIAIKRDLSGYEFTAISLENRRTIKPEIVFEKETTKIIKCSQNEDVLLIIQKRNSR